MQPGGEYAWNLRFRLSSEFIRRKEAAEGVY